MLRSLVSIVIPAYNEERSIGQVIEETISTMDNLQLPYEIIVVDDGSADRTRQVASKYKVKVLSNDKNRGKGYAEIKGFQHAQGDIIVTLDADGAHNPKEIPELVNPLFNGTEIVSGSRFMGKGDGQTSTLNRMGNLMFNMAIMVMTGRRITDSQTGFRAFKKDVLMKLNLTSPGYEIETEITIKSLRNGFAFEEKPINCRPREHSASKLRIISDGRKILKTIVTATFAEIA